MKKVKGSFEVNLTPAQDEIDMGRFLLDKTYEGPLSGSAKGQMLSHRTEVEGSAGYVALELFEGELEGKQGGFSLVHKGLMENGTNSLNINIIPNSGTGQLKGISGVLGIIIEACQHFYELSYEID
ncbi:DUF3224 domain-containing protein [Kangiella sp. TOML190]|uniref:DUF3224 domain-containing protein n=1 Tax=Kangiella sp. TOML190 TaxID=2931351 RepID=UPI00203E4A79|nr:DUF3224 domain-containing protein [Kangiella sp. TOML190]